MHKKYLFGFLLLFVGIFYAVMSLASMALYVFVETKMAGAIYADEQMQWAFRILCALVAGAIFVLIVTPSGSSWGSYLKKYAALLPLLVFSIGSTMTSNIGMLSDNDKLKQNNADVIEIKKRELQSLYEQQALLILNGNVSHKAAPEVRHNISVLSKEIEQLSASQTATIKEKYAGLEIDFILFKVDVESVFKLIGGSIGIISLFVEFIFAWACRSLFVSGFALISQGFAADSRENSQQENASAKAEKETAKDKRTENRIQKAVSIFKKKELDDERHKMNALVGIIAADNSITNCHDARKYADTEKGYSTRMCEKAFSIAKQRRQQA